eukprot:CAMPEP_0174364768 /NCGR_PEP_ID=MMETSP0811_2-20130205/74352_1 /TAXON_ID=73025 ORGANISM="Eutreptiella gymnastica-like, Strain CCMP1594" /NCGR_SAMPLE_ID=MMETSP0811_2 /ASSEMBLY_ACC=CAM_ASM_000667 /LENGTH=127 /DNA_ID=CAMNT_0015504759 /DNA_START=566 /DNA_END=946 /DNA_ORIENTATION=+
MFCRRTCQNRHVRVWGTSPCARVPFGVEHALNFSAATPTPPTTWLTKYAVPLFWMPYLPPLQQNVFSLEMPPDVWRAGFGREFQLSSPSPQTREPSAQLHIICMRTPALGRNAELLGALRAFKLCPP